MTASCAAATIGFVVKRTVLDLLLFFASLTALAVSCWISLQ